MVHHHAAESAGSARSGEEVDQQQEEPVSAQSVALQPQDPDQQLAVHQDGQN